MRKTAFSFPILIFLLFCSIRLTKAQYSFIRYDHNQIILPTDSSAWFHLGGKFRAALDNGDLKVLHFGDSHIQADYFTGQVRKDLFNFLKTSPQSRGITMPYKVAGTNGPDELFSKSEGCSGISSIRKQNGSYFALTGYSITSCDSMFQVSLKDTSGYRFNKIFIFHNPLGDQKIRVNGGEPVSTDNISDSLEISEFLLNELSSELYLMVSGSSRTKVTLYGISLENTGNKISYHSLGINGATFGTFLKLQDSQKLIRFFDPDCVVLSYGTNDALSRKPDTALLKNQIRSAIAVIRSAMPGVPVILTTPGDYLIGNKYVNPSTFVIARLIKETAIENNCACWDFYEVMGGAGSVRAWYKNQLVFKDGIHLSKKGYHLQGDLFFSALMKLKDLNGNE